MKQLFIILFASISFFGCQDNENVKTLKVGNYYFDVPSDFVLVATNGVDSYTGYIKGDSLTLGFDYGYYSSDLTQSIDEYLLSPDIQLFFHAQLKTNENENMDYGKIYVPRRNISIIDSTSTDSISDTTYTWIYLRISTEDTTILTRVIIPKEIFQSDIIIDTTDNIVRRIVMPKENSNSTVGIVLTDLNSFNNSLNGYLKLGIAASNVNESQKQVALNIFNSIRTVERRKPNP